MFFLFCLQKDMAAEVLLEAQELSQVPLCTGAYSYQCSKGYKYFQRFCEALEIEVLEVVPVDIDTICRFLLFYIKAIFPTVSGGSSYPTRNTLHSIALYAMRGLWY